MRTNIVHEGAHHLVYEIRQIVEDAQRIQALGVDMTWENIGDPVAMGERIEPWIIEIVQTLLHEPATWAYCPSRGVTSTREYLASEVNKRGGAQIGADDILFFNGVADAVDKVYDLVHRNARILMPSPTYTTHTSNEVKRGGYNTLFFHLDPDNNWEPDIDEIRWQAKYNPAIAGIAFINPDNPTGKVYSKEALLEIVEIARQNDMFIICDEIYAHICYNGATTQHMSELVGDDVPALVMRGISKEYPWPGSRCGWLEILNCHRDEMFREYVNSVLDAKRMEVCSTSLPQMSVPLVFGDERYPDHLRMRAKTFEQRAKEAYDTFKDISGVRVNLPQGALYFCVVFDDDALNNNQSLPIENAQVKGLVEKLTANVQPDKRLAYYLMGAAGICVTPLSGCASKLRGFRITLLQNDDDVRRNTLKRLNAAITAYLASA